MSRLIRRTLTILIAIFVLLCVSVVGSISAAPNADTSNEQYRWLIWNTSVTNDNWTVPANVSSVDFLVVAGGGNGGNAGANVYTRGGGGGAGGLILQYNLSVYFGQNFTISVGANEQNSTLVDVGGLTYSAWRGGHGAGGAGDGFPGGSGSGGGGAFYSDNVGGAGLAGQGQNGTSGDDYRGGGGGGYTSAGNLNDGGAGIYLNISGANQSYAFGGGGGTSTWGATGIGYGSGGGGAKYGMPGYNGTGGIVVMRFTNTSWVPPEPPASVELPPAGGSEFCNSWIYLNTTLNYTLTVPFWATTAYGGYIKYLVVAGGGAAGYSAQPPYQYPGYGGGGGAGGLLFDKTYNLPNGSILFIKVGAGGENSTVVSNDSVSLNLTAVRGGKGGYGQWGNGDNGGVGLPGGSGGGGGSGGIQYSPPTPGAIGGLAMPGQGFNGSYGIGQPPMGGGGGGAGSYGGTYILGGATANGGLGRVFNITTEFNISCSNTTCPNLTFAEGGNSQDNFYHPPKTTFGSGGTAYWTPYVGIPQEQPGNQGIVIIQGCAPNKITFTKITNPPKIVQFRVMSATGKELPNSTVSIQGINTTAGDWAWLQLLLRIRLDEAPVENTFMQGLTDTAGNIEFLMVPTVTYNITTTSAGYTFPQTYIVPHDTEYLIWAFPQDNGWTNPDPVRNTSILYSVSHGHINATAGFVTINYTDTGLTTTSGLINVSAGSTLLSSIPADNSINQTVTIPLSSLGTSVKVATRFNTTLGAYDRDTAFTFDGQPVNTGLVSNEMYMFLAIGLLFLTTIGVGFTDARYVAVMVTVEAWCFMSFGWFSPLTQTTTGMISLVGTFILATVFTILWNLKEGIDIEGK